MSMNWTDEIRAEMRSVRPKITEAELAEEMGVTRDYVDMLLNMRRETANGCVRMKVAISAIKSRRREESEWK